MVGRHTPGLPYLVERYERALHRIHDETGDYHTKRLAARALGLSRPPDPLPELSDDWPGSDKRYDELNGG